MGENSCFFSETLQHRDPVIASEITLELRRQQTQIELIASENIVSAAVLFPEKGLYFAFFRWLLRHHARDLAAMESIVRGSGLDWTIARPPRLTESANESFRALRNALPP